MNKYVGQFGFRTYLIVSTFLLGPMMNQSFGKESVSPKHNHELPLLPKGQHLGYIEGFNPDNPPKLRMVMDEAFQESLKNGMKVARVQMDWPDVEPTQGTYKKEELTKRLQRYHTKGLALYLLLCTADTEGLNYPEDLLAKGGKTLAGNMDPDNPVIVQRYKTMLDWAIPIARKHGVYCISVGNEPDARHKDNPTFMAHFIKFVASVRDYAHTIDPDIAITYTSTCDPALDPGRTYGKDIADAVDIVSFNFYGFGKRGGLDLKATEETFRGMIGLSKGKPILIQELGCSSIQNPDRKWQFHASSPDLQRQFFEWAFKIIRSTQQIRAAHVFQLVEHSPSIDKFYRDEFGSGMPKEWTRNLCDWLKGLGLISFETAEKKPAWNEFLKGLRLIYKEQNNDRP